jgi:toxin ParE1/3/4
VRYRLHVLRAAHDDVEGAAEHIQENNADAAARFLDAVEATYRELRRSPMRWPIYPLSHPRVAEVRKRAVIGFRNYLVFYRVEGGVVEIVRVLHGARDIPSILLESD